MSENYRITASALNVRETPSITAKVIGYLQKGDEVEPISKSGDGYWFRISLVEKEGWVSHKHLERVIDGAVRPEEFPWMPIALAEEGIKEFPGNDDNPRIIEYLKSTNLRAPYNSRDETPWCSAFANWCIERAGYEGTDSAWARSWASWGKNLPTPRRGCIVVFTRPPNPAEGHVGFYFGETSTQIKVLGGNQSDAVNVKGYAKSRLIGYRIPA